MQGQTVIPRFPLSWPVGVKRTASYARKTARFKSGAMAVSIFVAIERVLAELQALRVSADDVVVSTNLATRLDGLPRSGQPEPADTGVAVYWRDASGTRCIAIDRYSTVAGNLAAVAATLEAFRAVERHGGREILDRAFTGFAALPAPERDPGRPWREVLGLANWPAPVTLTIAETAYRRRRAETHPDRGGDAAEFTAVQWAIERAREELSP